MQREKNINLNWNVGNAFIRYVGGNLKYRNKAAYKKVRIVEIQISGEQILLFTIQSFVKETLGIAMKGHHAYQFTKDEWVKVEKSSGVVSSVMVSNQEVFIRAKFGHEKVINQNNVYIERHEIDAIFQVSPKLIEVLQKHEIKLYDFRVALN